MTDDELDIETATNKNLGDKIVLKTLIEMALQQECIGINEEGELYHFHTGGLLNSKF